MLSPDRARVRRLTATSGRPHCGLVLAACAWGLALALTPPRIQAQTATQPTAGTPASTPADAAGEIAQLIDRAMRQYASAQSYEDTATISTRIEADPPMEIPDPAPVTLAFVRPNKLALGSEQYRVVADGRKLFEAMDVWMEYSEAAAPDVLKLKSFTLNEFPFFRDGKHPLLGLILEGDRTALDVLNGKAQLTAVKPDTLDGRPGRRVTGTAGPGNLMDVEVWFDDQRGLLGEIIHDHTRMVQANSNGLKIRKAVQRMRFDKVRLNEPIPDDRFGFTPSAHLSKTTKLRMPTGQELQRRLVGKPAVAFTGKLLSGKTAGLDDYRGRVLMLDFWSLGCGPCIMSMPILQRVADKYAAKPVSIIGVNLDPPAAVQRVTDLLKTRGIKFEHFTETRPALAQKYFVEGIPFAVLIDGKGIVQAVHVGMADERRLSEEIDKLLEGKNLHK